MAAKRVQNLFEMRRDYNPGPLNSGDLDSDPFIQFSKWFEEALRRESHEANAMILSTVNINMEPSSRVVLLKSFSSDGFLFFTNYSSRKGDDISENNRVALLFFWPDSMRQIRIEGVAERCDTALSDEYFNSRPIENRASSALSKQSKPLEDRSKFEEDISNLIRSGKTIKRPENWGGYIVKPSRFEFWQGGSGRSHDRFQYNNTGNNLWNISRLYP
ncbi:MAG: pyridoxamine 5'-phosphate oxidase [Bacteroidales bacterium]